MSTWEYQLSHGYPVPLLNLDGVIAEYDTLLKPLDIWSIGRFGRYAYINVPECTQQALEAIDNIVFGEREITIHQRGGLEAHRSLPSHSGRLFQAA